MRRAPKQWCLTKNESVNSFENWKQNLTYTLSLDTNFAPFLILGASWNKLSRELPLRGFTDDANDVPVGDRRTAQQKCNMLHLMLGQIANYCPVISRNSIVKTSTSIESICLARYQAAFWVSNHRSSGFGRYSVGCGGKARGFVSTPLLKIVC